MTKIKVLSLKQPHAYLFSIGAKLNETRSFNTNFRGTLYIHASQKFYFSDLEVCRQDEHFNKFIPDYSDGTLKTGAIIGKVEIVDCIPTERFTTDQKKASEDSKLFFLTAQEKKFGDFTPGRFAWVGKNHTLLKEPILNVKGKLGIWEFDLHDNEPSGEPDLNGRSLYEDQDYMYYLQHNIK